jgi:hypothetical protein
MVFQVGRSLFLPPAPRCFSGDFGPPFGRHTFGPRLAALPPKLGGGLVLAFFAGIKFLFALPGSNLHDADGGADHVGWALLSFRAFRHLSSARHEWRRILLSTEGAQILAYTA